MPALTTMRPEEPPTTADTLLTEIVRICYTVRMRVTSVPTTDAPLVTRTLVAGQDNGKGKARTLIAGQDNGKGKARTLIAGQDNGKGRARTLIAGQDNAFPLNDVVYVTFA